MKQGKKKNAPSPIRWALQLIFPNKCIYCNEFIPKEEVACSLCTNTLPRNNSFSRPHIHQWVDAEASYYYYKNKVPHGIAEFKFRGRSNLADYFSARLLECLADAPQIPWPDCICYVPMYPARERERGYNQAKLLAMCLALRMELPCVSLLKKSKNNRFQHTLSAAERHQNVRGVYTPAPGANIAGQCILLVDDIMTTGATLDACAQVLKESGAKAVYAVAIARTVPD